MSATPATLSELRAIQGGPREASLPDVRAGFGDLASFELAQRAAKLLASSQLVPKQFQGNLANCVVALEMAQRIGASALMVMQNLYIVHGRPAWSSQFVIACVNQCGRFSAIRYEWFGTEGKDDWGCRAWAVEKATQEKLYGPKITIALAKQEGWYSKDGSKWKTIPQLMLMYRAGSWFGRTYAPELTMGLMTAEEAGEVIPLAQGADGVFVHSTELSGGTVTADGEITGGGEGGGHDEPALPTYAQFVAALNSMTDPTAVEAHAQMIERFPKDQAAELDRLVGAKIVELKKAAKN